MTHMETAITGNNKAKSITSTLPDFDFGVRSETPGFVTVFETEE